MKIATFLIALLLGISVFAAGPTSYELKNVRVIDGDTIEADVVLGLGVVLVNQSIRLNNIDAPEIHSTNPVEKAAGLAVKQYVNKRLTSAKSVEIIAPSRDKYGRILGIITVDGASLGSELLNKEYVRVYHGEAKTPWINAQLQRIIDDLTATAPPVTQP